MCYGILGQLGIMIAGIGAGAIKGVQMHIIYCLLYQTLLFITITAVDGKKIDIKKNWMLLLINFKSVYFHYLHSL